MRKVFETIEIISKTEVTVLITGESGTGKDLAARAIHKLSDRSDGPFVAVNCPNLPENILESELFGYRKGAFTHATQDRKGLFREAEGGTIIWTKSAIFRRHSKPSCCGSFRKRRSDSGPEQKHESRRAHHCLHKS